MLSIKQFSTNYSQLLLNLIKFVILLQLIKKYYFVFDIFIVRLLILYIVFFYIKFILNLKLQQIIFKYSNVILNFIPIYSYWDW